MTLLSQTSFYVKYKGRLKYWPWNDNNRSDNDEIALRYLLFLQNKIDKSYGDIYNTLIFATIIYRQTFDTDNVASS